MSRLLVFRGYHHHCQDVFHPTSAHRGVVHAVIFYFFSLFLMCGVDTDGFVVGETEKVMEGAFSSYDCLHFHIPWTVENALAAGGNLYGTWTIDGRGLHICNGWGGPH